MQQGGACTEQVGTGVQGGAHGAGTCRHQVCSMNRMCVGMRVQGRMGEGVHRHADRYGQVAAAQAGQGVYVACVGTGQV